MNESSHKQNIVTLKLLTLSRAEIGLCQVLIILRFITILHLYGNVFKSLPDCLYTPIAPTVILETLIKSIMVRFHGSNAAVGSFMI
jgi:hypothetical protein